MKILVKVVSVVLFSMSIAGAEDYTTNYSISNLSEGKTVTGFRNMGAKKNPFSISSTPSDCYHSLLSIGAPENVFRLNSSVAMMGTFSCTLSRTNYNRGARFTTEACKNAISCRNNMENSGVDIRKGQKIINELIALDYIKKAMVLNSDEMERFQIMKKFAQEKFDKDLGAKCINRFNTNGRSQCNKNLMEKAFEERQKECTYGFGCYNNDDTEMGIDSYAKFKSKNDDKAGDMIKAYFQHRNETSAKKRVSEDDKRIEDLIELAESADYKKAKQEQKINLIISKIGRDNFGRLKDPVIGYEFKNENPGIPKNADKFKEILKMMESKTVAKDFTASFNSYRKKLAQASLGGENSCSQTTTFINICNEASLIADGKVVHKDAETAENLTSDYASKIGIDYDILKSQLGDKFDEEDYNGVLNARRCVAFGIVDELGNRKMSYASEASSSSDSVTNNRMNRDEARGIVPSGPSDADLSPNGSGRSVVETTGINNINLDNKDKNTASISKEDIESVDRSAIGDYANGIGQVPAQQIGSNFTDLYGAGNFDSFASKAKSKPIQEEVTPEDNTVAGNSSNSAQDKMNEFLMKKLAAAEENLEKLRAETAVADEERAKQKKMDEEAALIKDLKGQIADLKTQSSKNNERKIASVADAEEEKPAMASTHAFASSGGGISASRAEAPAPKAQSAENFDAAQAAAPSQASQSNRSSSGSGAILSSVSNADGSKTTTLGSGLVVTTVDGMTTEKAQQTISNRILELNGTPFYIEEGGMVKEIIAVVKDGKVLLDENGNPIFEKIVKGKVGDKKFASKAKDKKDRAPAAITDAADLKRDQEEKLKRERAEYLKLRNITSGALKKK